MISLVARVRDCSVREAAEFIASRTRAIPVNGTVQRTSSPQPQPVREGLKPLEYLQVSHEAVQALGGSGGDVCAVRGGLRS